MANATVSSTASPSDHITTTTTEPGLLLRQLCLSNKVIDSPKFRIRQDLELTGVDPASVSARKKDISYALSVALNTHCNDCNVKTISGKRIQAGFCEASEI